MRIQPITLVSIPQHVMPELLGRIGSASALFADFDEELTTSVVGPFLIAKTDVSPETLEIMMAHGADERQGFEVEIGEWSDRIDLVRGDYCAYYSRQIVLTLDRQIAEVFSRLDRISPDEVPDGIQASSSPTRRLWASSLDWARALAQEYLDRFLVPELQIVFPVVTLFALMGVLSFWGSLQLYLHDRQMVWLLLWSLAPLFTYGFLFILSFFFTKSFSRVFLIDFVGGLTTIDLRRTRYTQIFLCLIILFASFGAFDGVAWWLLQNPWAEDGLRLALIAGITVAVGVGLFGINRRYHNRFSRAVVILAITAIFGLADSAEETIAGRSLFYQTFPIMLASFTVAPAMSFVTAVLSGAILTLRAIGADLGVNSTAYLGFLLIAFLSWLVSKGYEEMLAQFEVANFVLENRVAERTRQLLNANLSKSKFLAQVSHELQSPIVSIALYLRSIKPIADTPERKAIEDETNRLLEMAQKISTVSKLEIDAMEDKLAPTVLDMQEYVDKALRIFQLHAEEKKLDIARFAADEPFWFMGISSYATRVIENLLTNAIKYSDPGGQIRIALAKTGDAVQLQVADSGIGIPAADISRIFERFTRGSNAGDRPGTGLGLAMVKDMVTAMQGTISVTSVPGQGSTFTVTFPAVPGKEN